MSESPLKNAVKKIKEICNQSSSESQFFSQGGSGYNASIDHWLESSTELSHAAVQPGSEDDLQEIFKAIADNSIPFAIKCGGHNTNPGFSSVGPDGIHISLARFNKIAVHADKKSVDVGAGCLFDELYLALAPDSLNIVGGEDLAGIGVAGWLLGGGYSFKSNQYGLGIDNIQSVKIILPNGRPREVGESSKDQDSKDLFFAVKGGGNNFGIVTEFTLKVHDQAKLYYYFTYIYKEDSYNQVKRAIGNYVKNVTDKKATLKPVFRCQNTPRGIEKSLTVLCIYDGEITNDPFTEFKQISYKSFINYGSRYPLSAADKSTASAETSAFYKAHVLRSWADETYGLGELPKELQDREADKISYDDLIRSTSRSQPARVAERPLRGRWGSVMVNDFTPKIIDIIAEQHKVVSAHVNEHGGKGVAIALKIFLKTIFAGKSLKDSAWPHEEGKPNFPVVVQLTWEGSENDTFWVTTMKDTLKRLRDKIDALDSSSKELPYFINGTLAEEPDLSVQHLYRDNLSKLSQLRERYDPGKVMDRAGGFRIPLPRAL